MSAIRNHTQLSAALRAYYTKYYRDELGIPSWNSHVEHRMTEESGFGCRYVELLVQLFNLNVKRMNSLVVGAGTGAESVHLARQGARIVALEPDDSARMILEAKKRLFKLKSLTVVNGFAEELPFPDERFDLVVCYTVLEHTNDPQQSIRAIVRVLRSGGVALLVMPDYRYPFEQHYKMRIPLFLPRAFIALWLRFRGRPLDFFFSLRFVTAMQIRRQLRSFPVASLRVYLPYRAIRGERKAGPWGALVHFFEDTLGIQGNQIWIVRKIESQLAQ